MKQSRFTSGFTLVELMSVIVFIGVITAVVVSLYRTSIAESEAEDVFVKIRASLEDYREENSYYPLAIEAIPVEEAGLGITEDDLDGRYFRAGSYIYQSKNSRDYVITAIGNDSTGSGSLVRTINDEGILR